MAPKKRRIASLIESQLPGFITNEYENFSKFVEKYYEHLESAGQPLDILSNLDKYKNINSYEQNLLKQTTTLTSNAAADATTISVEDASSFPRENGYIKIGQEILFYQERTDTQFLEVSRGVSGNTTLGDLYHASTFVTTAATPHYTGDEVQNISNLFLYALVKEFEKTYLGSFPEAYLKKDVDKRTLIKNIGKFYKAKGTDRSVKFIFNSIISERPDDVPELFNPKDFTLKSSVSDWVNDYILKVKVTSGDPKNLIGNIITQELDSFDETLSFASAVVDNVLDIGDGIYQLVLEPSTINGTFKVAAQTTTTTVTSNTLVSGDRINVKSTLGFPQNGKILVGDEVVVYSDKTVNQFIIDTRVGPVRNHSDGVDVYSYSSISGNGVRLTTLGIVYNLLPSSSAPYATANDTIQVSESGFETLDPIIFNKQQNRTRWLINTDPDLNPVYIKGVQSSFSADIGAVLEDEQYYYICSSGYPKGNLLVDTNYFQQLSDQKHLKLIRKSPITTTEVYKTPNRDVGIFIDGTPALGYKDTDSVKFGPIVSTELTNRGISYAAAPYVLINEVPGKARANLAGSVLDSIEILTTENYKEDPTIRITSGEKAILSPVITNGAITSMDIVNPGQYYSSPPTIRIVDTLGKGNFAEYEAILSVDGQIESVRKVSGGRFYTRGYTTVVVESVGKNASAKAEIKKWVYDRYNRVKNNLDSSNGTILANYNLTRDYGYAYIANPTNVRKRAYTTQAEYTNNLSSQNVHSPILGYAYDGNPIYGPYGYSNPVDSTSSITRISSGYQLRGSRPNGPDTGLYPLGSFVDDYKWVPSVNSGKTELDANNGRFCVTPDYPDGVYAYFITVDSNDNPVFPYILGDNFYSLPVDSNYNSNISQDDIPLGIKSLRTEETDSNGFSFYGLVKDVEVGNVSGAYVESSTNNFSPGNDVHINNAGTNGSGSVLTVKEVSGKQVSSIESVETKAARILVQESAYLFAGDRIQQIAADGEILAQGYLIGDVINAGDLVMRDNNGSWRTNIPVSSETLVLRLVLNQNSNFTVGSTMTLTNDDDVIIATGIILETITRQNSVKIRVTDGDFIVTEDYYLRSTNLSDTNRSEIISLESLSTGLTPYQVDEKLAIVETTEPHGLGTGDMVNVTITPSDSVSTTNYYVRKRLYQNATIISPSHSSVIIDTGIGAAEILNSGRGYTTSTYYDVELIFQDQSKVRDGLGAPGNEKNAKATIIVSNPAGVGSGLVSSLILTYKGEGYKRGDVLTVTDDSLDRVITEESSQRLVIDVTHVGFAKTNTELRLSNVTNISQEDYVKIGNEILLVTRVDTVVKSITVSRGQQNTIPENHFNGADVTLYQPSYRFENGFRPFGEEASKPYLISYNEITKEINIAYEYSVTNPQLLSTSSSFFDQSIPAKLVAVKSVNTANYKLEFSTDQNNFDTNPVIKIQKYYKYVFDVSHSSMVDTYLDFSSSSNYNVFTEEKEVSSISPGNNGSFVSIKLGFGPAISTNNYQERRPINFQNYFYFIKVSPDVDTGGSYLSIIDDPLSGSKKVLYSTDTRFVYAVDNTPAYDGSGDMSYTTSSINAVGNIQSIKIINTGGNYTKIPIVSGISPTTANEAIVDPIWDSTTQKVVGFDIIEKGLNYVKPVVVIVDGDGINYEYDCDSLNGKLTQVRILKEGSGFTYKPTVRIAEGSVKVYLESKTIGVPKNVKINDPGKNYNSDFSTLRTYKSHTTLALKNISERFFFGEIIVQNTTGARAVVSNDGWRPGSNLLKVRDVQGIFENGEIRSLIGTRTAVVYDQYSTEFSVDLKSYLDNFGYYSGDKGKVSSANQRLQDSYYYQDYSYVIRSKTSIEVWRDLIKETTHPAGFQLFSEMVVDSKAESPMPVEQSPISHFSIIELPTLQVTDLSTKYQSTTSWVKFDTFAVENGVGSVSVDTFDTSETRVFNLSLSPKFDGDFDPNTGQVVGTSTFTLVDIASGGAVSVDKAEQLVITLDGVWQEPDVAYTVSGSQITFSVPPFGNRIVEGQETDAVKFYGRAFKFKNTDLTNRYFRKVANISNQFDGVQFVFDLYWDDDGTPVKTDPNENLIVGLNGVIQKARMAPGLPFGNSYQIERSENPNIADKIVFSKPPIDNDDAYGPPEELPEILKNYEQCFIYSVGSYERLTIQSELYEYRFGGPYLILDEITSKVRKIDEPKYALVFIDGVLQRDGDSYKIVGPNITFTDNLVAYEIDGGDRIYQNVSIVLLYGRDVPKTLTFYDFEPYTFNNSILVRLEGTGVTTNFLDVYAFNGLNRHYLRQGNTILGKVQNTTIISDDEILITFSATRNIDLNQDPIELVNLEVFDEITITNQSGEDQYSYNYSVYYSGANLLLTDTETLDTYPNLQSDPGSNQLITFNAHANNLLSIVVDTPGQQFVILNNLEYVDGQTTTYTITNNGTTDFVIDGNGGNPGITANFGDYLNFDLQLDPGHEFYITTNSPAFGYTAGDNDVPLLLANDRTTGLALLDTRTISTGTYYYVCGNHSSTMWGEITINEYVGEYWNEFSNNQLTTNDLSSNATDAGTIEWQLDPSFVGSYYYTLVGTQKYGIINVLGVFDPTVVYTTREPKVFQIMGDYSISYSYKTDDDGDRVLERTIPSWLYGGEGANKAWNNKFSMLGNLLPGDKILIDGESAYREVLRTPNSAKTTSYRVGDLVQNGYYTKASVSNYEGDTDGVGLSITANVNDFGQVTTLNVSDVEWNKRDFNLYLETGILLQPTAYGYYTTPEIHFIPVDGNGGGAKAEVIAHGGQILDIVITDSGSGYTQPPKVVVARRFKRIKEESRKIDSLTTLSIGSTATLFTEITFASEITLFGDGEAAGIFSVISLGGLVAGTNSFEQVTSHIWPEIRDITMSEVTIVRLRQNVPPITRIESFGEIRVDSALTTVIGGISGFEVSTSIKTVEPPQVTKIIEIAAAKAYRKQERTESLNGVGTFLDAPMGLADTIAYVPNTARFPDTPSRLRIGREVIYYTSKKSDRFLGLTRGYQNSLNETHNAGDLVLHYPESVTLVSGGINTIISEVSVSSAETASRKSTVTFQVISNIESIQSIDAEEFIESQVLAPLEFEPQIIEQIIIIPPTSYHVVTDVHSTVSTVRPISAPSSQVTGTVTSQIVTLTESDIQLTQEKQIQLDTSANITKITIGNVAATVSATSHVVTTNINKTDDVTTVQVVAAADISSVSTVISERISTIDEISTYVSVINTIANVGTQVIKFTPAVYTPEPFVMYANREITASVQDVDTFSTTFTMILGGGLNFDYASSTERDYRSAVVDFIIEEYVLEDTIVQRNNNVIILNDPYNEVIYRDGSSIIVSNRNQYAPPGFEDYTLGNAGLNLNMFQTNAFIDPGVGTGLSIGDMDLYFSTLTIRDFDLRGSSAFLGSGERFNFATPAYQTPVTLVTSGGTVNSTLFVTTTEYFNDPTVTGKTEYLFTASGNVLSYTGLTPISFTGVSVVRGLSTVTTNDDVVPFQIV